MICLFSEEEESDDAQSLKYKTWSSNLSSRIFQACICTESLAQRNLGHLPAQDREKILQMEAQTLEL